MNTKMTSLSLCRGRDKAKNDDPKRSLALIRGSKDYFWRKSWQSGTDTTYSIPSVESQRGKMKAICPTPTSISETRSSFPSMDGWMPLGGEFAKKSPDRLFCIVPPSVKRESKQWRIKFRTLFLSSAALFGDECDRFIDISANEEGKRGKKERKKRSSSICQNNNNTLTT